MRVCVLIDAWEPIWGGGQTHVWEICMRLVKQCGYSIDIYTRSLCDNKHHKFDQNEELLDGKLRIFRIGPTAHFFYLPARILWIIAVILAVIRNHRLSNYSLIHAHAYTAGIPGKVISVITRIPICFTVHGSNNLDLNKRSVTAYIERFILTMIPYSKEISVSQTFLQYKNINTVEVIPNGVDTKRFKQTKRSKHKKTTVYLWVGRDDPVKGLNVVLAAFKIFMKKSKNSKLRIVGDFNKYENTTNEHSAITFVGKMNNESIVAEYQKADVYVLSSFSEGFPITILEAWATGLPVIATSVGEVPYLVKDHINGVAVKPDDVKSLVRAFEIMKDTKLRSKLGKNGCHMVQKLFTWDKVTTQVHRIYENLI